MFNLENAVREWKRNLAKDRNLEDTYIHELEAVLRDEVADLVRRGASEEEAFRRASAAMGETREIGREFAKVRPPRGRTLRFIPVLPASYVRIALRKIRRQKGYSAVNIAGLAVGLACCLLITLWISAELDYDRFHQNGERLFQVLAHGTNPNNPSNPILLGPFLESGVPEVERAVRYDGFGSGLVRYGEKILPGVSIQAVDPGFFQVISFPFLKGDPATALEDPSHVVIGADLASALFEEDDPLGKILIIDNQSFLVSGVMQPIPERSTVEFDAAVHFRHRLLALEAGGVKPSWGVWSANTFILAKPGISAASLSAKIENVVKDNDPGEDARLSVIPFRERRLFFTNIRQYLTLFAAVAAFILVMACLNFINMSTARAAGKAREIGIRKVSGANRGSLIAQYLGESLALSLLASLLAVWLALLALPWFNTLSTTRVALEAGRFLPAILGLALFAGIGAGLYPAFLLSSFKPIQVLRGRLGSSGKGGGLRRGLVVFQFGLTILLMIGTASVDRQLRYIRNKDLGYDRDRLLAVSLPGESRSRVEILKEALRREGAVAQVTGTAAGMANLNWSSGTADWPGKNPDLNVITYNNYVDEAFLETFGVSLRSGRFFSKDFPADGEGYVINEAFERLLGSGSAEGKTLTYWKRTGPIIGVLKDFHFQSLQSQIQPLVLMLRPNQANLCYLRIPEGGRTAALQRIESVWKDVMPEYPFQYRFMDESLDSFYRTVRQTGRMANTFTILAVFIACLGLLSLASFMLERRAREVSIRKVMGASTPSILLLLTRELAGGVLLANLIAWPAAYFIMSKWLEQFAYRTPLGTGIFVLSAAAALLLALLTIGVQTLKAALRPPASALRTE